jgi:hypothetical protein
MGTQGTLVAEGCYVLCEIVVIPGRRGLFGRGHEGGQEAGEVGGCGGGQIFGWVLHGLEHIAQEGTSLSEFKFVLQGQIPEEESQTLSFEMKPR